MKRGLIKNLLWAYIRVSDGKVMSLCYADTYFEAVCYFEEAELADDPMYDVKIMHELTFKNTNDES